MRAGVRVFLEGKRGAGKSTKKATAKKTLQDMFDYSDHSQSKKKRKEKEKKQKNKKKCK